MFFIFKLNLGEDLHFDYIYMFQMRWFNHQPEKKKQKTWGFTISGISPNLVLESCQGAVEHHGM